MWVLKSGYCICTWLASLSHCVLFFRISCREICSESLKTATDGRNSGWFSPTSVCSSTKHIRWDESTNHVPSTSFFDSVHWTSGVCLQDEYPLASLPLLGYSITIPSESENIHKDYVFKLHFKSHVYYFRSESEYTFERHVTHRTSFTMLFACLLRCEDVFQTGFLSSVWCHRWMEVIRSATCSSSHTSTIRKEPHIYWPKRERERRNTQTNRP